MSLYAKFREEQAEILFETMESLQYSLGEYEGNSVIREKDFSLLKDLGIAGASLELEDFSCVDFTCFSFGGATYKFSIIYKNCSLTNSNKEIVKQLKEQTKSIDGSYKESHDIRKHPHLLIAKALCAAKQKYEWISSYYHLVRLTKDTYFFSMSVKDDEKIEEMRLIHYLEVNPESIVRGGIKTLEPYYEEKEDYAKIISESHGFRKYQEQFQRNSVMSEKEFYYLKKIGLTTYDNTKDLGNLDFSYVRFYQNYPFKIIYRNYGEDSSEIIHALEIDQDYYDSEKELHILIGKSLKEVGVDSYYYLVRITEKTYYLSLSVDEDDIIESNMDKSNYLRVNKDCRVRDELRPLVPYGRLKNEKSPMEILKDLKIITNASTTLYNHQCLSCKTYTHYLTDLTANHIPETYCVQCTCDKLGYMKTISNSWIDLNARGDAYILYLKKGHLFLSSYIQHDEIITENCKGSYIGYDKNKAIDKLIWEN